MMMITKTEIMKQQQQQNQCGSNVDKVNSTTITTSTITTKTTVNDDEEDDGDRILINGSKSTHQNIIKNNNVFIVQQKNFQDRRQSSTTTSTTTTKFLCTVLLIFNTLNSISTLIYDGVSEYQVMEGDTISLPCNISLKEWNQNQISLMVWYRSKNQGNPIYSIDTRNSLLKSKHQIMPELKGRIEMDFENDPPRLHIDSVQINDSGDYRCRVDYRMNRTKHFLIHLNVSVLPKNVVIRDLLGNIVQGMIQTPFNEGDKVTLFCDAIGGSPPPIVIWKNDDAKIIDDSYEIMIMNDQNNNHLNNETTTIVRNILTIQQLDRGHLLQEITCEAYPPILTNTIATKTTTMAEEEEEQSLNWTTKNNNQHHHQHHHNSDATTNNAIINNNNHHHYNHHNSFVKRTSVVFDLNLRPLSVQIQVPNFQPNLNRSLPGTSQTSSSSSSSLSSLPYGTTLSTNNNNGNVLVVSAGKKTEIECRSWGSRPPAEITWWRASRRLPTSASRSYYTGKLTSLSSDEDSLSLSSSSTSSEQKTTTNNNLTISMLTYTAAPEDDGQRLTCRADNTHLEQEEIEDSVIISVRYAPLLTLSLGPKIPENIREGSDVYLECISKSNPPLSEVVWLFEGKPLINDPVQGILVTNQSLVMQRVRREHRGYYQCAASNPEGISASNKIFLNVHFAPVCRPTQTIIYGVARTEQVSISCEVEAEPVAPIQFRWFFNNSFESYELPMKDYTLEIIQPNSSNSKELEKKFFNNPDILSRLSLENVFATLATMNKHDTPSIARSNATYWPRTRIGYGLLYCLAENSVGNQRDPCVFTIVEAGPPNSVHDCRIVNVTMASFILECIPGENGGLRQIFHLEVYNIEKEHLQVNVTSMDEPVFAVENLPHDTAFMLNVFSSNAKGRSDSVTLRTATSAYAAKHTTNGKKQKAIILDDINQLMFNPIFGALIVALFSLILLCMATVVFIRSRFCLKNPNSSSITNNNNSNNNNNKVDNNNVQAKNDCQIKCKEKFTLSCTSSPSMPSSSSLNPHQQQQQQQQQHPHHYIIGSQHHHHQPPPMSQQHQFSAESNLNQSTYYDYQPHITSGTHSTSLSTNDSTTAMTDLSSIVQLNKHLETSSYYMASSSGSNNQHVNVNNNNDIMQPVNIASSAAAATLLHRYPATSSDLMTNAFTYNVASSASTSNTNNAIYPISNDLIKIGTDLSAAACPYRIDANTISRRMPLLKPITGCMESLSSSTSDKTNDPDEEWSHNVKHNLHSNNNTNIIQQPGNQINPSFVPYTSDSMNNQSGALL